MKTLNFKINVMAIAIGMFVLTSCGGGNSKKQGSPAETPASTEQAAPAKGGVYKVADDDFDGNAANIPAVIKNGVGTLNEASVSGKKVELKFKNIERSDFEALVNFYKNNGGTVAEAESSYSKLNFNWGTLEVSFFGFDEEAAVTAVLN
jgi:hypothetical protein